MPVRASRWRLRTTCTFGQAIFGVAIRDDVASKTKQNRVERMAWAKH